MELSLEIPEDITLYDSMVESPEKTPGSPKIINMNSYQIKIISLDLDDFLGNFGYIQDAYNLYCIINKDDFDFIKSTLILDIFFKYFRRTFRNGAIEFIQKLNNLYLDGKIYGVVLFTSAGNTYHWIDFIVNLLEYSAVGTIGELFKLKLTREDANKTSICGATIKDLKQIVEKLDNLPAPIDVSNILMFDDKAFNIVQYSLKDDKNTYQNSFQNYTPKYRPLHISPNVIGIKPCSLESCYVYPENLLSFFRELFLDKWDYLVEDLITNHTNDNDLRKGIYSYNNEYLIEFLESDEPSDGKDRLLTRTVFCNLSEIASLYPFKYSSKDFDYLIDSRKNDKGLKEIYRDNGILDIWIN